MNAVFTMLSFLPPNRSRIRFFSFSGSKMENRSNQSKNENILALVLRRSTERLNGKTCNRDTYVNEAFVIQVGLNLI